MVVTVPGPRILASMGRQAFWNEKLLVNALFPRNFAPVTHLGPWTEKKPVIVSKPLLLDRKMHLVPWTSPVIFSALTTNMMMAYQDILLIQVD